MDDSLPSSFARAADFQAGAQELIDLNYGAEPAPDADRREEERLRELCGLLDEYQEQPHLLDPSLESLVSPLLLALRQQVRQPEPPLTSKRLNRLARLVYYVTKVRGSKVIVRFFPHEVADLSLLIPLLSAAYLPDAASTSSSVSLSAASWELRYVLLLWLSVVVRLPFDLTRLDQRTGQTVERLGYEALRRASKEGDGGVEVLARFYSRQDAPLDNLLKACEDVFSAAESPILITSHLTLLSTIFRNAQPARLLAHWSQLYHILAFLPADAAQGKGGALLAKMRCKVAGRLALLKLSEMADGNLRDEDEVPEEVEVGVGELIEGLAHPDTLPRYSSAKYLARLCQSLPPSFASQIIYAVLSVLEEALSEANEQGMADRAEGKVQGACLAVGELARRGLIGRGEDAEEQVGKVVKGVLQALGFDHQHLSRSLGTSARDSAAYVLWSLSRTLPAPLARQHAQKIAERLVCTALFDREVQVRRAASAAFQEGVGRWSIFPHGIDVLRKVDFFTVSVRHRAYLQAAPSVAEHLEYRSSVLAHLVDTGVGHYDPDLRTLSAKALGAVVSLDPSSLAETLAELQLEKLAKTKDSSLLHGLLLSLAALADGVSSLPAETREALRSRIFAQTASILIPCGRQLKSSPLVLSAALSSLAASAPSPSFASTHPPPAEWSDMVLKACEHTDEGVHDRAGEAMAAVSKATDRCVPLFTLLAELDSRSGTRQQAAVLILGKVDFASTANEEGRILSRVVERLTAFVQREHTNKAATIEARRNGVEALAEIVQKHSSSSAMTPPLPSALSALQLVFSDYTTDQRGDVGSWVRMSTLRAWSTLLPALSSASQQLVDAVVASMMKQAVERLDNVREVAGKALMQLWQAEREVEGLKLLREREVWEGIASEERQSWRDASWASERLLPLLSVSEYREQLLEGAVLAASQYSTSTPFLDFALTLPALAPTHSDSLTLLDLLTALHALAKRNFASNRIFVPFLSLLASLAEAGALDEVAYEDAGTGVLEKLLGVATNNVGKMKAAARVKGAGKVVTAFLPLPSVGSLAAAKLPVFLTHSQAWLRQQVADDVFSALGALGLEDEAMAALERTVGETSWSTAVCADEAERVAEVLKEATEGR
ncbi:hypothetical protein JCM10213_002657 [Rhodosporidiobolus nylandii]